MPKEVVKKTGPFLIPIADPLADEKMTKKVLKLAKKASKRKQTKRGTKEVVKGIRKGLKGCAASCLPCVLKGSLAGRTMSKVMVRTPAHPLRLQSCRRARSMLISQMCCRICILAGDISPIDVITHIPVLCEENQIPYIYVPSKEVSPALALPLE